MRGLQIRQSIGASRLSRLIPRPKLHRFFVQPDTLLLWHREVLLAGGPTRSPRVARASLQIR